MDPEVQGTVEGSPLTTTFQLNEKDHDCHLKATSAEIHSEKIAGVTEVTDRIIAGEASESLSLLVLNAESEAHEECPLGYSSDLIGSDEDEYFPSQTFNKLRRDTLFHYDETLVLERGEGNDDNEEIKIEKIQQSLGKYPDESSEDEWNEESDDDKQALDFGLIILVCSANLGNAQPTPESISALIPEDGDLSVAFNNTEYPIPPQPWGPEENKWEDNDTRVAFRSTTKVSKQRQYARYVASQRSDMGGNVDIIAIGMQEATFVAECEDEPGTVLQNLQQTHHQGDSTVDGNIWEMAFGSAICTSTVAATHKLQKQVEKRVQLPFLNLLGSSDHVANSNGFIGGTKVLHKMIMERCPSYECLVHYQRGEMRLILLVRKDIVHEVEDVHIKAHNTGVAKVLANKGGILAHLTVRKTCLAFLSAHLTAHESIENYKSRCANLADIFKSTKSHLRRYDPSVSSHHCFVFGDLNYRISLLEGHNKFKDQVAEAIAMVRKKDWITLNGADELSMAIRKKHVLAGFQAIPCHFPPTFKVKREKGFAYNTQRIPSYTDRILWKSVGGLKDNVEPLFYEPCPGFITSDHKPVRGAFSILTNSVPKNISDSEGDIPRTLHLFISNMKCTDINSKKIKGIFRPYMRFSSDPPELVKPKIPSGSSKLRKKIGIQHGWRRSKILLVTPDFGKEKVHLRIKRASSEMLAGSLFYLSLMHDNGAIVDEKSLIGTVAVNLQRLCDQSQNITKSICFRSDIAKETEKMVSLDIDEPLIKNSQYCGNLTCSILAWWLTEREERKMMNKVLSEKSGKGKGNCPVM